MNSRSFLLSTLIAGLLIGIFGNLPLLNLINCFLCLWVWIGGILAVVFYRQFQQGRADLTVAQGAGLGALAGLIGAVVGAVVFAVTSRLSFPIFDALSRFFEFGSDFALPGAGFWEIVTTTLVFLVIDGILYPIFGALGGMIGASILRNRTTDIVSQ
jgi:hypothetical protein